MSAADDQIKLYLAIGFKNEEILVILNMIHNICMKKMDPFRRKQLGDLGEMMNFWHQLSLHSLAKICTRSTMGIILVLMCAVLTVVSYL